MKSLPIDPLRPELLRRLRDERPLVVSAPTGSGKSTRLPLWMAEALDGPVLVVEPRRIACRSLAEYLARGRGERAGESIGYSVRFDERRSAQTEVLFVTPGVALRMLHDARFGFAGVLLDEFHERGWQVDVVAAILQRRRAAPGARRLEAPLVFTSATLDTQGIASALGAEVMEASGRSYPVDVRYLQQVPYPTQRDLDERVAGAVATVFDEGLEGDVLVFLPGKGEIADCARALGGLSSRHGFEVVEVHGGLPTDKLSRALRDRGPGDARRVFLSTNVAETSLTLPDVRVVIDSGLVRMQLHRGGRTVLALTPTSQASMDQRAGRAGRVAPGVCLRLWEQRWEPSATTAPEIARVELDDVLLQAAMAGLSLRDLDEIPWVTPPPPFAVGEAMRRLREAGVVDEEGALTDTGRHVGDLPMSVFEARMLLDPPAELRAALADLVAVAQRGSRLLLPADGPRARAVREARRELFRGVTDEVSEALVALRRGDPHRHGIHGSALAEVRRIARSLRELTGCDVADPTRDDSPLPRPEALAEHLLRRIPEAAFVLRERAKGRRGGGRRGRGEPWSNGEVEVMVFPYEPHHPDDATTAQEKAPVAGLILSTGWVGGKTGYGVRGFGNLLLPAPLRALADAEIGEVEITDVTLRRRGGTEVQAHVERTYAGVTLESDTRTLRGRALCDAAAELTMQGRLFKGAAPRLLDAFHLWRLLHGWQPDEATSHWDLAALQAEPVPEPKPWLAARLSELGLTRHDELALLEADDLMPDLEAMSGAMGFEIERLAEEFPRLWQHQGGTYSCTVYPTTRKVVLEPIDAAAKKRQEPSRQHVPRFGGYTVIYRKASREVVIRR